MGFFPGIIETHILSYAVIFYMISENDLKLFLVERPSN